MGFSSLRDYAIIGNDDRTALIDRTGSIDWCCFPHVAAPSVFARLLDDDRGGYFAIRPTDSADVERTYLEHTNVLETTFTTPGGTLELTDFMPLWNGGNHDESDQCAVYRRASCTEGSVTVELEFRPRLEYALADTTVSRMTGGDGFVAAAADTESLAEWSGTHDESLSLHCCGDFDARVVDDRVVGTETLAAGDTVWFRCQYGENEPATRQSCEDALESTVEYWKEWTASLLEDAGALIDDTPWGESVLRSGLVLKLLINEGTGAIYAAPTTSLPEKYGTDRNWDYRYNWIRDAKFTVQALYNLGRKEEARDYFEWFRELSHEAPAEIKPMYGVHGETELTEYELSHLSGYRYSSPVRIGNGAADQAQHDIYGAIVQAVYETLLVDGSLSESDWDSICAIVDHVCDIWDEPDCGIWEYRDQPRHYVHSKLLCWVALDRGIELAEKNEIEAPLERWRSEREAVRTAILEHGYSDERGSFVQHFETDEAIDAACLLIPIYEFLPPDDERVQSTLETIREELATDEGFVYRTKGSEAVSEVHGTFVFCTCWLIDALVLAGRVEEAEEIFTNVLDAMTPLGLLSERIHPETGELYGNFPQAFSHIGVINNAIYLASARTEGAVLEHDPQLANSDRQPFF
ncbi:glycoside hydrolase family 15 protein [Natronosalvus vescus]|uniref:glycoside hydrolase family 15 protein n=1 Tax=Natronosalvus vescus TaxID=2953881 RepID=UPI002091E4E1|nr:glycoside hydrolase family 15 protein [Natronosalvus vescus]